MLLKLDADFYCTRHPNADEVLLLIEVSDSTLSFDQHQKLHLYARHYIPEYWIVNLNDNCLEIYREPNGENYAQKTTLRTGIIQLSQCPDISLDITAIL